MLKPAEGKNHFKRLSILSRFNGPFAPKKPRNVSEYSIELDEPYKTFAPGDHIRGHVTLNVERPVRITHLTICLHGVVKVLKNGRISSESINRWRSYLATGQGKWGEAYFGNGLAALFKDEVVLAGDGCLTASSYRFNFNLELPAGRLPSSIDFQHGGISYLLSSTLTRPTTLRPSNFLPTSRSERIIAIKETIDVANLPDPIPQVIPLESIHRKPRRTKTTVASQNSGSSNRERSKQPSTPTVSSPAISEASDELMQSPSVSNVSCASTVSSARNDCNSGTELATRHTGGNIDGHSTTSSGEAAIAPTATVKMLQSGCLPGDTVSAKVTINLDTHFMNPHGITLTLYRECHIDMHPAIPLGSWQDGNKRQYEDYYPKSRTGLGGLSLSSGGTSRVFRQDISQQSTALYVDGRTLTASVKASTHVPDGVFPTISTVPGKMIDFKYYVETIIDLRGKSAIQERILPRLSMVNPASTLSPGEASSDPRGASDGDKLPMNSGLAFLDTSQLRREKGVVTHIAEVVVGTRDSRRSRPKKVDRSQEHMDLQTDGLQGYTSLMYDDLNRGRADTAHVTHHDHHLDADAIHLEPVHDVPAPDIEDDVDDKTRLRRAEERLLPSAPPEDEDQSAAGYPPPQPSAPAVFDEYCFGQDLDQPGPSAPAYNRSPVNAHDEVANSGCPGPAVNDPEEDCNGLLNNSSLEDKQELERRRLQAQASSPNAVATGSASGVEPSAPALVEEDAVQMRMSQATRQQYHTEHLPRYWA
ncbi:MAG: hypothetical protein LQ346_001075 [Caloplaca aetnensis]|nr:MAG: hypothetical protein LQ346_001075 [Caloplaca aetnensis]